MEQEFDILLPGAEFPNGQPLVIPPPGLSLQRQQYLYKNIREFVDEPYKDQVCPKPVEDRHSVDREVDMRSRNRDRSRSPLVS